MVMLFLKFIFLDISTVTNFSVRIRFTLKLYAYVADVFLIKGMYIGFSLNPVCDNLMGAFNRFYVEFKYSDV